MKGLFLCLFIFIFMAVGSVGASGQTAGIVDNEDPGYVEGELNLPPQPSFWGDLESGYNNSARYTGNSYDNTPRNWATWTESGVTGEVEVFAMIPGFNFGALTTEATYKITHAGGDSFVKIDQKANEGKSVSLGTYTFNGTGSVYLNDVVPEKGAFFISNIVFDAVSFGVPFDANADVTGPTIELVKAQLDNGKFIIQARVTDDQSGVAEVKILFNGQLYTMNKSGDIYSASISYTGRVNMDYYIIARDVAGNVNRWNPTLGYVSRSTFNKNLGIPAWAICDDPNKYLKSATGPAQVNTCTTMVGDPINTVNGNLVDKNKIIVIGGRPEIDLHITYNSLGSRVGIFGENWTHSYNYHLLEMDNADFQGAFVSYPDGQTVKFSGPDFIPEAGYYERLIKTADGFELIFKDLSKVKFDADGEIVRYEDANGNGLTFTYSEKVPFTLLSRISKIKADGGREINLSYNDKGFVEKVDAPEGKTIKFEYDEDTNDLITIVDGRSNPTRFEYTDHYMTKKVSPKGHKYFSVTYGDEGRASSQTVGENFKNDFTYESGKTIVTDAYDNKTEYVYDGDGLVKEVKDARGRSMRYEHDENKNIKVLIDRDNNRYEFGYDGKGNLNYEKDPKEAVITRVFDLNFNKPTSEVYKIADHITKWEYDSKGNLKKVIDAFENDQEFGYNDFGQMISSKDFNDNQTVYEYNGSGDLEKVIDPYTKAEIYLYDGLGRRINLTNERGKVYTYTYDANDNLRQISGPLGYKLKFEYDKNNNLVKEFDANGGDIEYKYDSSENLIERLDQLDFPTKYTYGSMNELLSETDAEGRITKYEHDSVFNVKTKVEAFGTSDEATTKYSYNGMRYMTEMVDPENRLSVYKYDELERLIERIDNVNGNSADHENNVSTKYEYSPTSQLTKLTDANQNVTNYSHDKLDRLIGSLDAENQATIYEYDPQSNLKKKVNPRTFDTEYFYDKLNRLEKTKDAKGGITEYGYDENSNLIRVKDANGIVTGYEYDDLDRNAAEVKNLLPASPADASTNVRTELGYDLHGNLTSKKNPRGIVTTYTFDDAHRNIKVTDVFNKSTLFEYDKVDNLRKVTDKNGHSYSMIYDKLDRVTKLTNPEDHFEIYTYDKVGNVISSLNMRGKVFGMSYDPLNRVSATTDPYGKTKVYSYDAVGNNLSLTDENGHTDRYEYDKVYRLRKSIDAENFATEYEYDKNGNTVKVVDGNSNPTVYKYDELDRLIEKVNAENEVEKYQYDALVNLTIKEEADTTLHKYNYDPLYRLAGVINNFKTGETATSDRNVETKYGYDANDNLLAMTDPLNHTTSFGYDELDRLITETNPITNQWSYKYDFEKNVIERTDANSVVTGYEYYPDDVLRKIDYPTYDVDYQYNETNNLVEMHDQMGKTSFEYDDLDRVISQLDPLGRTLKYEYDFVGNTTKLTYPDSRNVTHQYLKNDWLRESSNSDGNALKYTRDGVGMPTKVERTNSSIAAIKYDKVYRTLEINDRQIGSGAHLISKFNYEYNDIGDITRETAEYGWRQPSTVISEYKYDGLHRLNSAISTDGSISTYRYDAAGNRVFMTERLKQGTEARTYTYDESNALKKIEINSPLAPRRVTHDYTYDKNGNRVDKLIDDKTGINRGVAYTYDFENRLIKAQDYQGEKGKFNNLAHSVLEYDGNGRRLVKTYYPGGSEGGKRSEYTFDRLDPVVQTDISNGQRLNLYRDSGQNLAFYQEFKSEQAPSGTLYWYHYDGEGNISGTTKHQAQSDHTYRYDEYGLVLPENGNWTEPHNQYTLSQKEFDGNMDLHYFGARHYDASTGTWISQDSYRGELDNPSSKHRYMYNYDSPINYIDKYGFVAEPLPGPAPSALPAPTAKPIPRGELKPGPYSLSNDYFLDYKKALEIITEYQTWQFYSSATDLGGAATNPYEAALDLFSEGMTQAKLREIESKMDDIVMPRSQATPEMIAESNKAKEALINMFVWQSYFDTSAHWYYTFRDDKYKDLSRREYATYILFPLAEENAIRKYLFDKEAYEILKKMVGQYPNGLEPCTVSPSGQKIYVSASSQRMLNDLDQPKVAAQSAQVRR